MSTDDNTPAETIERILDDLESLTVYFRASDQDAQYVHILNVAHEVRELAAALNITPATDA